MIEKLKQNNELWNLFTKEDEYNPMFTDQYDRVPYYVSSYRNIFEPKVSKFLLENGLKPEYPDGKKFAVCLTHDIDSIYPQKLRTLYNAFRSLTHGQIVNALKTSFSIIDKSQKPLWNFKDIMELEEKYNAKSSFYFLALDPDDRDFSYEIEDLEHELGHIVDNGWEVGLHGGHESYNNLEDIKRKKLRLERVLGKKVVGYRNHYLRFKVPDTWELLSRAGFKYDTTFAYADCVGFRNGMCHPFRPFNLSTNKEIDILEIPLNIMDVTMISHMNIDQKRAWELTKQLIDTVEQYNGVFTILFHNDTYKLEENFKFYEKMLKYCSEKGAWMTSGEEICNWWMENVRY
ncbi:hypothetical protein HNV12_10805 [Methanococcoides sp. SA1]|nr:hypothetical protein [Methanococcoides sp. SA1]